MSNTALCALGIGWIRSGLRWPTMLYRSTGPSSPPVFVRVYPPFAACSPLAACSPTRPATPASFAFPPRALPLHVIPAARLTEPGEGED